MQNIYEMFEGLQTIRISDFYKIQNWKDWVSSLCNVLCQRNPRAVMLGLECDRKQTLSTQWVLILSCQDYKIFTIDKNNDAVIISLPSDEQTISISWLQIGILPICFLVPLQVMTLKIAQRCQIKARNIWIS